MATGEIQIDDAAKWEAGNWILTEDLLQAIEDAHNGKNLYGPFATGEEAVASMLEDD